MYVDRIWYPFICLCNMRISQWCGWRSKSCGMLTGQAVQEHLCWTARPWNRRHCDPSIHM